MHSPKRSGAKVAFSRKQTLAVLGLLLKALQENRGLVAETADLVENQVPEGVGQGSREHALFLFAVVPNDRGVKSSLLWQRAKNLHAAIPWLFDPSSFAGRASERLVDEVGAHLSMHLKPRYAKNAAIGWVANSVRLHDEFSSDARNVFSHGTDGEAAYKAIRSFFGFGPKTGGMMYRAATGLGWASREAASAIEVPVDTHDVRISIQLGILQSRTKIETAAFQSLATAVRRELSEACRELNTEWFDIDRAMWLIGSRGCARRRCGLCPLSNQCSAAEIHYGSEQLALEGLR